MPEEGRVPVMEYASRKGSHVGEYGASVFSGALHRVAVVNNIPIAARSWCHGSIARRMNYLQSLSSDPGLTAQFDRFMLCLYGCLLLALGSQPRCSYCRCSSEHLTPN